MSRMVCTLTFGALLFACGAALADEPRSTKKPGVKSPPARPQTTQAQPRKPATATAALPTRRAAPQAPRNPNPAGVRPSPSARTVSHDAFSGFYGTRDWNSRWFRGSDCGVGRSRIGYGACGEYGAYRGCGSYGGYGGYLPYCSPGEMYRYYEVGREIEERERGREEMELRAERAVAASTRQADVGKAQLSAGKYHAAVVALTVAAELNQGDPACRILLAQARLALGHYAEAGAALRRALELQPKLAYLPLGLENYYDDPALLSEQLTTLAADLKTRRGSADEYLTLGFFEMQIGNLPEANRAFRIALRKSPKDALLADLVSVTRPPVAASTPTDPKAPKSTAATSVAAVDASAADRR